MKILPLYFLLATACLATEPVELKLWPEGAPGQMAPHSKATEDFIRTKAGKSTITDIHEPTITVYRPDKPNGTSVIVAPGGGYVFLSAVHEGTQVCEWLNSIGVTGILLKYRTPTRDEAAPHEKPVQDAAKAIALVREHAQEWQLNPKRVGLLGFSAGGNLLAHLACDRPGASHLPDFGINIYGGGFVDPKEPTKLKTGFAVPADAPPMFIACAHDDGQNPFALTALYLEYKKHDIPAELHLFTQGGHGFGMRKAGHAINDWPQRCAEWMASMGWTPAKATVTQIDSEMQKLLEKKASLERELKALCVGQDYDLKSILKKKIAEDKLELSKAKLAGNSASQEELLRQISVSEKTLGLVEEMDQQIKDLQDQLEDINETYQQLALEHAELQRAAAAKPAR